MVELINVHKIYNPGKANQVTALDDINIGIDQGEFCGDSRRKTVRANPHCLILSREVFFQIQVIYQLITLT